MVNDESGTTRLRFLATRHLQGPLVDRLDVWTRGGKRIGTFDGIVIDPEGHRARYLVVDRSRLYPDRCLIPLPAHLDLVHQALCVDVDLDPTEWPAFNPAHFTCFGSDDESTATVAR
jgi:PRC-barrel domain